MKKLLLLLMMGCSSTVMAESLANDILKNDTINGMGGIKMILAAQGQKCDPKLIEAKVLQKPTDVKLVRGAPVSGYWKEKWTVECNHKQISIPIKFLLDPTGASWVIRASDITSPKSGVSNRRRVIAPTLN